MPTITRNDTFTLDGVTSNACFKQDGTNTVSAMAIIRPRKTRKRPPPPGCCNGFKTDYMPFAKGHVLALEIGGPDISENIVAQFEYWQGNGPWRQLEIELLAFKDHIVVVDVSYSRGGVATDEALLIPQFGASPLMDWTDPRIPSAFRVRVYRNVDWITPANITSAPAYDAACAKLHARKAVCDRTFDLGTAMPATDRQYWIGQKAVTIVNDYEENLPETKQALKRQLSRPISLTLLLEKDTLNVVRDRLANDSTVTPTEAASFQLYNLIHARHDANEGRVAQVYKKLVEAGLGVIPVGELGQLAPATLKRKAEEAAGGPAQKKYKADTAS